MADLPSGSGGPDEPTTGMPRWVKVFGIVAAILLAAGALVLAAAMVWLSIHRGLRPIDHMIDAARRIAGGDLTARTATTNPATEVGQLSTALNSMLDRIELPSTPLRAAERRSPSPSRRPTVRSTPAASERGRSRLVAYL